MLLTGKPATRTLQQEQSNLREAETVQEKETRKDSIVSVQRDATENTASTWQAQDAQKETIQRTKEQLNY